jgi:hypothetical protein
LGNLDIAEVNLACAEGLPGEPTREVAAECLDRLNHYARCAEHYTKRRMPEFHDQPDKYDHSESIFRVLCMVTLLQRQFGVRYHPDKKDRRTPVDTADTFIHGALIGQGGTCASLPVVYAAVGRRLGYPIRLVATSGHLFCRWHDPGGERFNIEVNDTGLNDPSDDYYRTWPYELTPEKERPSIFLKSGTPREELSGFLAQRGFQWLDLSRYREAVESFIWASVLAPVHKLHEFCVVKAMERWRAKVRGMIPPNFPSLEVNMPPQRRYPAIPAAVEHDAIGWEAVEVLLSKPEFERDVVRPLRDNPDRRPPYVPNRIVINVQT